MTTPSLRSRNWFGRKDLDGFVHRSWIKAEGFSDLMFDGRPVIGIANSWSELTNCNAHLRQVAEAVLVRRVVDPQRAVAARLHPLRQVRSDRIGSAGPELEGKMRHRCHHGP